MTLISHRAAKAKRALMMLNKLLAWFAGSNERGISRGQAQNLAHDSTAIQAGGSVTLNVTNAGLTVTEVRQLALDVFKANFHDLKGAAKETAASRGEELTDKFLSKLEAENPAGLQQAESPDFQDALFTVQKEYAKAGDKDLGDLLVDLLVDRTKQVNRDMLQIVLNESLRTAPKVTNEQVALLSIAFFFRYAKMQNVDSDAMLVEHLQRNIAPLIDLLATSDASFQHLQFTACANVSLGEVQLVSVFLQTYPGLFSKGLELSRFADLNIPHEGMTVQCLNDPTKVQVMGIDLDNLNRIMEQRGLAFEPQESYRVLFVENRMSANEVREKVVRIAPFMENVFTTWSDTKLKNLELTSVGIALGHANIKRIAGGFADLSIWIK